MAGKRREKIDTVKKRLTRTPSRRSKNYVDNCIEQGDTILVMALRLHCFINERKNSRKFPCRSSYLSIFDSLYTNPARPTYEEIGKKYGVSPEFLKKFAAMTSWIAKDLKSQPKFYEIAGIIDTR